MKNKSRGTTSWNMKIYPAAAVTKTAQHWRRNEQINRKEETVLK